MAYRIVLLGDYQSGKSRAGNTFLGENAFCWAPQCKVEDGEVAGKRLRVVESPGWDFRRSLETVPGIDIQEFKKSMSSYCAPGPHAVLLTVPILLEPFPEERRVAIEKHMSILENMKDIRSQSVWRHTLVLFTFGDRLGDRSIEQHIEGGGEHLQWLVDKCGNRYHVFNNLEKHGPQATQLMEKIEKMVAGNGGGYWFSG